MATEGLLLLAFPSLPTKKKKHKTVVAIPVNNDMWQIVHFEPYPTGMIVTYPRFYIHIKDTYSIHALLCTHTGYMYLCIYIYTYIYTNMYIYIYVYMIYVYYK